MTSLQVGVLVYDGCTLAEVLGAATRLRHGGSELTFRTPSGASVIEASGLVVQPTGRLDATTNMWLLPGGDPGSVVDDAAVHDALRSTVEAGGRVHAICGGVVVLAAAGLLAGRRITHNYRPPWAPPEVVEHTRGLWLDADVIEDRSVGVVEDGPIVTALPNAVAEFSSVAAHRAGLIDAERSSHLTRHLRGEFVTELFEV